MPDASKPMEAPAPIQEPEFRHVRGCAGPGKLPAMPRIFLGLAASAASQGGQTSGAGDAAGEFDVSESELVTGRIRVPFTAEYAGDTSSAWNMPEMEIRSKKPMRAMCAMGFCWHACGEQGMYSVPRMLFPEIQVLNSVQIFPTECKLHQKGRYEAVRANHTLGHRKLTRGPHHTSI